MTQNFKAPKLRFPGFTEDWEQRKLSTLAEFNPKSALPEYFEYVDLESVVGTEMVSHRTEEKVSAPSRAQRLAKEGDVFYQTVRPYQRNNYLFNKADDNYVFSTGYAQMRPYGDGYFLLSLVQTDNFVNVVLDNCTGTSYPAINSTELSNIEVSYPKEIEEQKKIGQFFKSLDNLITLHQRKFETLKKLKKGFLQKMFPKNGESVPEIRFPGFTDAWEQRKFCEIANRQSESVSSDRLNPFVEYEDVVSEQGILNKDLYSKDGNKKGIKFTSEDVLYGKLRPYLHNWLSPDFSGVAVGDWWVLRPIKTDKKFLFMLIQTTQFDFVANQSVGTKMPRADWNLISNIEFYIPKSNEEQKKVGNFFSQLDKTITLHQRKLDTLKKLKQGMLQQMFI